MLLLCTAAHLWSGSMFVMRAATARMGSDVPLPVRWGLSLALGPVLWALLALAFASLHGSIGPHAPLLSSAWLLIAALLHPTHLTPREPISSSLSSSLSSSSTSTSTSTSTSSSSSSSPLSLTLAIALAIYLPLALAYARLHLHLASAAPDSAPSALSQALDLQLDSHLDPDLDPDLDGRLWLTSNAAWDAVAFHSTLMHAFLHGRVGLRAAFWSWESPLLANARPSHPMLADAHAALFAYTDSLTRASAWTLPALFLSLPALALLLTLLAHRFLSSQPHTPRYASHPPPSHAKHTLPALLLAPFLALLYGGHDLVSIATASPDNAQHSNPTTWPNVVRDVLLPNRGALFAYPIALSVVHLTWSAVAQRNETRRQRLYVIAGFCTGVTSMLLPQLFPVCIVFVISSAALHWESTHGSKEKTDAVAPLSTQTSIPLAAIHGVCIDMAFFLGAALLIGLPPLISYLPHEPHLESQRFPRFFTPVWAAFDPPLSMWLYLWRSTGLHLPLTALAWPHLDARQRRLYIPFLLVFALPAFSILQPNAADNALAQILWLFGQAPVSALALTQALPARRLPMLLPILLAALLAPPLLETHADLRELYVLHTPADLRLAAWVRTHTDPASTWLLPARALTHPVASLAGRSQFVAHEPWIWPDRPALNRRSRDIATLLATPDLAKYRQFFEDYHIDYVALSPTASFLRSVQIDQALLAQFMDLKYDADGYRVYENKHMPLPSKS